MFSTVDSRAIIDETKESAKLLRNMKELGCFGLQIPEKLQETTCRHGYARACEKITNGSLAVTVMVHLPKLATGKHTAAFALRCLLNQDSRHIVARWKELFS